MSRYDTRDPTATEMRLTRAIHHLMALRRLNGPPVFKESVSEAALETLFEAKRQVKAEIKAKSALSFRKWRDKA